LDFKPVLISINTGRIDFIPSDTKKLSARICCIAPLNLFALAGLIA